MYAFAVRGSRLVTEGHATGLVALPHLRDGGLTRSFVTDRPVSNGFPARSWCCDHCENSGTPIWDTCSLQRRQQEVLLKGARNIADPCAHPWQCPVWADR